MMLFRSYWRKLIKGMIETTPGIGCPEEAERAVTRSKTAVSDSYRVQKEIAGSVEYLETVVRENHFRDHMRNALTRRTAQ